MSLNPKDFFDPIEGEPLRDLLGSLQNANIKSNQREANAKLGEISSLLRRQQAELNRQAKLPPCPYCGGRLEGQYEICKHCRNGISWVEGYPCKPGNEAELKRQIDEAKKYLRDERVRQEERARAEDKRKAKEWEVFYKTSMWVVLFSCIFILIPVGLSKLPTNVVKTQDKQNESDQSIIKDESVKILTIEDMIGNAEKTGYFDGDSLSTLSPEDARRIIMKNNRYILHLNGIHAISLALAKELSKQKNAIFAHGLIDINEECAKELEKRDHAFITNSTVSAKMDFYKSMKNVNNMINLARETGFFDGDTLRTLTPNEARTIISTEKKWVLYLNKLDQVSLDLAKELANCENTIFLNGLKNITDDAAEVLASRKYETISNDKVNNQIQKYRIER